MIAAIAVLAAVGWAAAAGAAGLWWGERCRRIAAEHYVSYGTPDRPTAQVFTPRADEEEGAARELRRVELEEIERELLRIDGMEADRHTPEQIRAEAERIHASLNR